MKSLLLLCGVLVSLALPARAKAYFQGEEEMIAKAEVIAVIELGEPAPNPERVDPFAPGSTTPAFFYRLKSAAKTIRVLKGKLPDQFEFHGGEAFICAQCKPSKGRFLAFLKKDDAKWAGSNWQLSLRPVADGKIEWFVRKSPLQLGPQDEEKVIARVREMIEGKQERPTE